MRLQHSLNYLHYLGWIVIILTITIFTIFFEPLDPISFLAHNRNTLIFNGSGTQALEKAHSRVRTSGSPSWSLGRARTMSPAGGMQANGHVRGQSRGAGRVLSTQGNLLYGGIMQALREAWSQAASGRLQELQPETLDLCQPSPLPDVSQGGVWRGCSFPQGSHQFFTEDCS